MSANNYIYIAKDNRVSMRDADTGDQMGEAKQFDTLEEAVVYAQEICDIDLVEYGIHTERRSHETIPSDNSLAGQEGSLS